MMPCSGRSRLAKRPMCRGGRAMKLLSISDAKGYFLAESGAMASIDGISKDDLLRLAELALTDETTLDEYDASLLQNQAHQIIYANVASKLRELSVRKKEFLDESKRLYLTEYERYSNGTSSTTEDEPHTASAATPSSETEASAASAG
jgi:hypothetical protein